MAEMEYKVFEGEYTDTSKRKPYTEQITLSLTSKIVEGRGYIKWDEAMNPEVCDFNYRLKDYSGIEQTYFKGVEGFKVIPIQLARKSPEIYLPGLDTTMEEIDETFYYFVHGEFPPSEDDELPEDSDEETAEDEAEEDDGEDTSDQGPEEYVESEHTKFILRKNLPEFVLEKTETELTAFFIGEDRSLNILAIDGEEKKCVYGHLTFDKIRVFVPAGTIHASKTTMPQDYASSFVNGFESITKALISGKILGYMGIPLNAYNGYVPEMNMRDEGSLRSQISMINDTSVILNYYSYGSRRWMNVELPGNIFSFLQAYLPEKRYVATLQPEMQGQMGGYQQPMGGYQQPMGGYQQPMGGYQQPMGGYQQPMGGYQQPMGGYQQPMGGYQQPMGAYQQPMGGYQQPNMNQGGQEDEFQKKLRKLKMMRDEGVLSEDEYKAEKNKLLGNM